MRNFRKALALVLALAMVLTTFGVTVVSAAQYGDTSGHWAESYIDTWSNYGVIQGDGGYFRPDDAITRAEVAQVTQNVISYVDTAENTFVDVSASDWFADAVLKLVAAGALTGNGDGTMATNNFMTREEAMTMLARAYGLTVENSNAAITQYADYQSVSDYATGYVGTMTSNGFVGGYEDGTVRPQAYISRAEFVKLLDNMIKLYITAPGAYGPEYVSGLVMVKTGGVTINGVVAKGIVVSPQVSGDVTITGSQVSGNIVNLSKTANVTSNTGSVVNPNATTKPNTILNNYGGYSGGGSGGSSTSTVRVRFYNGSALVATKTVTKNAIMTGVPDAPAKTGYSFTGWYTTRAAAEDPENHTAFNFGSTKITSAMDFFAGYIESTDPTASPAPTATPAPTPVADLDPAAAAYAPSAATEVSTTITYKDSEDDIVVIRDTLTGVELVKDTDYTIEDNKITFTEQFLNSLYDGVHKIEIITHSSEEGTAPVFELTVTGSTVATPSPAPTATPEPTAEPTATPTAEPIGEYIVWDFGKEPFTVKQEDGSYSPNTEYFPVATNTTRNSILSNSITAERFNGLAFTTKDAIDGGYQKSAQSYDDGFAGTYQIKSGKAGSATDRVFTYTPKTNGVFTVYAKSGSGTNATTVTIEQGSNKATLEYLGTDSADGKKPGILSLEVVANQQIKIYGSNNTGYFGMKFVETVTPTEVPATATPAPTATQTPVESYVATLNVANGNGVLKDAQGNVYPTVGPATAEPTEAPTNAPTDAPTAEPTEAPTAEPIATATSEPIVTSGDNWKASAALTAGSTLLSTDNIEITNDLDAAYEEDARTVGGVEYVGGINLRAKSKTDITGDTTKNACVLTVTAKTSGVLTAAYLRQTSSGYVSGDGKDIRVSQGSTVLKADSFETYESVASGEDADARRTATSTFTLEAGQTYMIYALGTTMRLYGLSFDTGASSAAVDGVKYVVPAGDVVTVDVTPDTAGQVPVVAVDGTAITGTTFTMPAKDVNVDVDFEAAPAAKYKATLNVTGGTAELSEAATASLADVSADTYVVTSVDNDGNTVYAINSDAAGGSEITLPAAAVYGDVNTLAVYNNDGNAKWKLGDGGYILIRNAGVLSDTTDGLQGVVSVKVPYNSKLKVTSGGNGGGEQNFAVKAQIGLGTDNATAKTVVTVNGKGNDSYTSTEDEYFEAQAGDVVYIYAEDTSKFRSVTFIKDESAAGDPTPTAEPTAEPTATPTAEPTEAPTATPTALPTLPPNVYEFEAGTVVAVNATPDTEGQVAQIVVKGADGTDIAVTDNTFVMPEQDVTVDVTFAEPVATEAPTATATAAPDPDPTATSTSEPQPTATSEATGYVTNAVYFAEEFAPGTAELADWQTWIVTDADYTAAYEALGKPFGELSDFATRYTKYYTPSEDNIEDMTFVVSEAGTYNVNLLLREYSERGFIVTVTKEGEAAGTELDLISNQTKVAKLPNNETDLTKTMNVGVASAAIDLEAGTYTLSFASDRASFLFAINVSSGTTPTFPLRGAR